MLYGNNSSLTSHFSITMYEALICQEAKTIRTLKSLNKLFKNKKNSQRTYTQKIGREMDYYDKTLNTCE